ncbi:MAG: hypothetical protein LH615_04100 [Ferruginibacter sp.]|nr:hypothetical protein [Ferruginibacter sp.]
MITIDDYLKKAIFVRDNLSAEVSRIIQKNKEEILDLNRDNQLFYKGINSDGALLKPYSPVTIFFKKQEGKPYNRTTLFDTGAFTKSFDLINRNNTISIFSKDSKSSLLQDKYGTNIFGLTNENQNTYNYEIIKPDLMIFLKKYI